MSTRIHIVGTGPRTGTTLMAELMVNGFEIGGFAAHEMSIYDRPAQHFDLFCSKNPQDVMAARPLLAIDRSLWMVCMLRDPRDMIVSKHRADADHYWTTLRFWNERSRIVRSMMHHPRFVVVSYEDLVRDPDRVQESLMAAMPFLRRRRSFSDYHEVARPSGASSDALTGVRPITAAGVDKWREHKPRVAAQLELLGPIADDLIEFGYEEDADWLSELDGVEPSHYESHWPEHRSRAERMRRTWQRWKRIVRYALSASPRVPVETAS